MSKIHEMIELARVRDQDRKRREDEEFLAQLKQEADRMLVGARVLFGSVFVELEQEGFVEAGTFPELTDPLTTMPLTPAIRIMVDSTPIYLCFNVDSEPTWVVKREGLKALQVDGQTQTIKMEVPIEVRPNDPDITGDHLLLAIGTLLHFDS